MSDEALDLSADPAFVTDPYPLLDRLREDEPVRRVRYHGLPACLVTRFADAQAVLCRSETGRCWSGYVSVLVDDAARYSGS